MLKKIFIKNFKELNLSTQRTIALNSIEYCFQNIKTEKIIEKNLNSIKNFKDFYFVSIGKCAFESAQTIEKFKLNQIKDGIAYDVNKVKKLKKIKTYQGNHPLASFKNIKTTKKIIDFLKKIKKDEKILLVISGGGSALLCQPINNDFKKENKIIELLMKNNANIEEINIVRKHLSFARGGFLAKYLYPKKTIVFIFSDVFTNNLQYISSGPTVKDNTTIKDTLKILKKYKIEKKLNFKIKDILIETPKEEKYFKNIKNKLVLSNVLALKYIAKFLKQKKYNPKIITSQLNENAQIFAKKLALQLQKEKEKTALIYGGEMTVKVKGKGIGGRNQELALASLNYLKENELILAINSDGFDNTPVAGAIADFYTLSKAKKLNLNIKKYLKDNNSFIFFKQTKDFILTNSTGINIADIIIALKN